jgi:type IV pilus assembly protein PilN
VIRINLLPWRETKRRQRQRAVITLALSALLATAAVMFTWRTVISGQIDAQIERNSFLQAEIKKVDKKLKAIADLDKTKSRILSRMEVIQELQSLRPEAVHLMDELVTAMPEGVHLRSITQSGRTVQLNGLAESNARVSALMRQLEASPWLRNPQLSIVENKSRDKAEGSSEFKLRVGQVRAQKKENE